MSTTDDLKQRRHEVTTELTALREKRERAFRANSDALAREHAGVTHHDSGHMQGLADDETAGDTTMTGLRRELEEIDAKLHESYGIRYRIMRLLGR
jgi:hypothetical protein